MIYWPLTWMMLYYLQVEEENPQVVGELGAAWCAWKMVDEIDQSRPLNPSVWD